jgi:Flp pilus assembly protein TadG
MNSRGPASGNARRQRGAAMVEFAIVLPLLLVIFFGLVETGRALILQHQLLRQTEAAARYLGRAYQGLNADCSIGPNWSSASDVAAALLVYGSEAAGSTPLIADMESDDVDTAAEQRTVPGFGNACVVTVTASVAYPSIFGDTIPLLGIAQPTLQARSEERYVGE